jgi:ABC-type multidrug transport system fused ATPase/permease subunit
MTDSPAHLLSELTLLRLLHILSPAAVIFAYFAASLTHVFRPKDSSPSPPFTKLRKSVHITYLALTITILASYISESVLLALVLPSHAATTSDHNLVYTMYSSLVWLILILGLTDLASSEVKKVFCAPWALALLFNVALLLLEVPSPQLSAATRIARTFLEGIRVVLDLALLGLAVGGDPGKRAKQSNDEEVAPLLARMQSHLTSSTINHSNGNAYGAMGPGHAGRNDEGKDTNEDETNGDNGDSDDEDDDYFGVPNNALKKDWWVYTKAFAIFLPHLWPKDSVRLQLHLPALVLCLLANRALNVLVPLQLGLVINMLHNTGGRVPWLAIGIFSLLCFLDSSAGVSLLKSWLWLPIEKHATQELKTAAYNQIMRLSCDFHDSKESGRTWRIVSRGSSLADLVSTVGFEMAPMAVDLIIAVSVFWWLFDAYMAFIVALAAFVFLWTTAKTISWRTARQRELINAWETEHCLLTESTLNWNIVSYFNRIGYEKAQYEAAVVRSQNKHIRYQEVGFIITALRASTLQAGLMVCALLAAYQISKGNREVGDFVVLITYWGRLTTPLAYFASGFSRIAGSLVDAEKLLELLQRNPTVAEPDDATELVLKNGQIDFDRVCFSYDGKRKVADDLSFRVEPGQTVTLVGETGGGKSTILKLLFRFYDATSGNVMIDGQDSRQSSQVHWMRSTRL